MPSGTPTYDANGNLTYDTFHTYAWDADGNLYELVDTATTMTYDALGRRVEQATSSVDTEILYGPGGSKLALIQRPDAGRKRGVPAFARRGHGSLQRERSESLSPPGLARLLQDRFDPQPDSLVRRRLLALRGELR